MQLKSVYIIFLFLFTITFAFDFENIHECIQVGPKGCLHWNKTSNIFDVVPGFSGFSANTSVLTKKGPRTMA